MTKPITLLPVCRACDELAGLKAIAATLGIEMQQQVTSEQALDQIRHALPDMVLLDAENVELSAAIGHLPILLLTDNSEPEFLARQVNLGIDDFIFTPLNEAWAADRLKRLALQLQNNRMLDRYHRQTLKMNELGDLVGLVSHEVASPLGNVNTAVSFLLESSEKIRASFDEKKLAATDLDRFLKQMHKALTMCVKNSNNAGGIINSFRSVATNQCQEKVTHFYLHRYIDDIVLTLKSKLKKLPHEIHVVISEGIDMVSDAGAFSEVIQGLINKSIVHGLDDNVPGQIILNAAVENRDGMKVIVLNYIDNGKGMPGEQVQTLLSDDRATGSSSLTTAILGKIVQDRLQGTIEVESTEGKGVHYTIVIPQSISAE